MDRSHVPKAGKGQGRTFNNYKASELPKIGIYQPSNKPRLVLPFANRAGEVTKHKTCTSTNTCGGVNLNSLPKIVPGANTKRSFTKPAPPGVKKNYLPLIKAPLYPKPLLQHKMTSTVSSRRTLSAKPVRSLVPLRAQLPIDRAVKPSKPMTGSKPILRLPPITNTNIVSQGSCINDGDAQPHCGDYVDDDDDTSECRMTPEQQWIIANLLSNCSPIVRSICSSKCKGIVIPPPPPDSDSDDEYSDDFEEDSDSSEDDE